MATDITNAKWIEGFTSPRTQLKSFLGLLLDNKLLAKKPIIDNSDDDTKTQLLDLLETINFWENVSIGVREMSKEGGAGFVLTKINDEWFVAQTNKILRVLRDGARRIIGGSVYVNVRIANAGVRYFIFEEHLNKQYIKRIIIKGESGDTPEQAYNKKNTNMISSSEFYLLTGELINEVIETNTDTFFILQNQTPNYPSDIFGVSDLEYAKSEIEMMEQSWKTFLYALRMGTPRLVLNKAHGSSINVDGKEIEGDKLLDGGVMEIKDSNTFDGSNPVAPYIPNPQVIEYAEKNFEKRYRKVLEKAGFSGSDDNDGAQKSEVEVSQIRDAEHTFLEGKISRIERGLKNIIMSLAKLNNIVLENFSIVLQKLDVQTEMERIDSGIKLYKEGLETKIGTISNVHNISTADAQAKLKEIEMEMEDKKSNIEIKENENVSRETSDDENETK